MCMEDYGPYGHHKGQEDFKTEIWVQSVLTLKQNRKMLNWLVPSLFFTRSVDMDIIALA